ncbi:MAG: AsmA-like C-terminal region-containing protein, partial [Pseudomonadota bacterium]|nr:AsmA-like C-terminal region-containing protein [Pseudomonadota bacterium]
LKDWLTSDTLVEQVLPQMAGVDANIDLAIDTLTLCGVAVNGLTLDTTLDDGSMELRRLTLDTSLGARLEAKGRIDRLSLLTGMDLSYSIVSTDWDRLIRAVAGAMLLSPERTGLLNKMAKTVVVSGRMTGSSDKTGIEMTVDLGESGRLEIGGDMTVAAGPNSFDMTARLTHPETSALMTLFGMDVPTAFEDAPADLFARIEGTRQNFVFKDLQGGIGDLTVMGSVSVDRSPARPVVVIDLTTGILDVPGLWPEHENDNEVSVVRWPDTSFCSNWLSRFDGNFKLEAARLDWPPLSLETARLNAGLKDGVLVVRSLSGKLAGGEVNLDGRFDSRGPLPKGVAKLRITGGHLDKLGAGPLAVIEGAVDLDLNLQAEGDSTAAMIRHLSGSGQISARGGHLAGFDVGAVVAALAQAEVPGDFVDRASVSMQQGRTPFRSLDASLRFDGGLARTEDLKIVSDVVTATARGVVDLPGWTLDILTVFKLAGSQPPPPFSMRLTGYVDAPEKDFDFAGLREHLVGRAAKALIKSLVDQKDGTTAPSPPQPPKPDHKAAIQGVLERILDSNEGLP